MPETSSSLDHFCEMLRHNVGCDLIGAVDDALINWWVSGVPVPNPETARVDSWGVVEGGTQCSSVLYLSNYQRQCSLTLFMNRSKYERPICTDHWQGCIQLYCSDKPDYRIRGADAANFAKVVYKCYGIIVRDLRDKGFTIFMSFKRYNDKRYDLAARITIRPITAKFEDDR